MRTTNVYIGRKKHVRLACELRYQWARCKYLHKTITVREGSVVEEGVSMPIRYEPEAIENLVKHSAHIRASSLNGLDERVCVSLIQGRTTEFDKLRGCAKEIVIS